MRGFVVVEEGKQAAKHVGCTQLIGSLEGLGEYRYRVLRRKSNKATWDPKKKPSRGSDALRKS
jgi:hypothetical protein